MQIRQAFDDRHNAERNMELLFRSVLQAETRMSACLEKPVENLRILEIGPGQGLERARYFGIRNEVIGLDLDVIPVQTNLAVYLRMLQVNGFGRLAKTLGRKIIVGSTNENAWSRVIGAGEMSRPRILEGDICGRLPELGQFDLIMSWSVFEHLPDPKKALENVVRLLRPGGVLYLSLHLYTSNNGHHDIRAFTGQEEKLPMWGHLRESTRRQIQPSSYLNRWRLFQWREQFSTLTPGFTEFLESHDHRLKYGPRITREIQAELGDFTEEELFTVDAVYVWKKQDSAEGKLHVS
jgi:SAM-dependent methyltransferase